MTYSIVTKDGIKINNIPDLVEAIGESNRAMPTVVSREIELTYLLVNLMVSLNFK